MGIGPFAWFLLAQAVACPVVAFATGHPFLLSMAALVPLAYWWAGDVVTAPYGGDENQRAAVGAIAFGSFWLLVAAVASGAAKGGVFAGYIAASVLYPLLLRRCVQDSTGPETRKVLMRGANVTETAPAYICLIASVATAVAFALAQIGRAGEFPQGLAISGAALSIVSDATITTASIVVAAAEVALDRGSGGAPSFRDLWNARGAWLVAVAESWALVAVIGASATAAEGASYTAAAVGAILVTVRGIPTLWGCLNSKMDTGNQSVHRIGVFLALIGTVVGALNVSPPAAVVTVSAALVVDVATVSL